MACNCDFDYGCDGYGMLQCSGCGGEVCVCTCGGERPCGGCSACEEDDPFEREDEAEAAAVSAHESRLDQAQWEAERNADFAYDPVGESDRSGE
jgi:hypothetical protein